MKRPNIQKPEDFKSTPMGSALEDLAQRMRDEDLPPVSFNVVGGFALMLHGVRPMDSVTDIDYVGRPLPKRLKELVREVGLAHQMEPAWINNDVLLSGNTMDSFEFTTGKLTFHDEFSVGGIGIRVLDEKDLLRMKLIAVDTSMAGVETGGEFSRKKDLPDVKLLMDRHGVKSEDLFAKYGQYIQPMTQDVIQAYEKGGDDEVDRMVDEIGEAYREQLRRQRAGRKESVMDHQINPFLAGFIKQAQDRADKEKEDPWD